MIRMKHLITSIVMSLLFLGVTTFGPEGNDGFYFIMTVIAYTASIAAAYYYGYLQCREASENVVKVHGLSEQTEKVKVTEYDSEGFIISEHEYRADAGWLSGFRKIIHK
jgi:hypothetical protein